MPKRLLVLVLLLIAACSSPSPAPTPTASLPTSTPTPPPPEQTALAYFDAWARADYASMYKLLTPSAQAALSADPFASRYDETHTTATVKFVRASLKAALREGDQAIVDYHLEWDTTLF